MLQIRISTISDVTENTSQCWLYTKINTGGGLKSKPVVTCDANGGNKKTNSSFPHTDQGIH